VAVKTTQTIVDADLGAKDVVPSSSIVPVKLNDAIKFSWGSSMLTLAWRPTCQCFTANPTERYLEVIGFRWGVAEIRNSNVQGI
jgi:hypothetical protein